MTAVEYHLSTITTGQPPTTAIINVKHNIFSLYSSVCRLSRDRRTQHNVDSTLQLLIPQRRSVATTADVCLYLDHTAGGQW